MKSLSGISILRPSWRVAQGIHSIRLAVGPAALFVLLFTLLAGLPHEAAAFDCSMEAVPKFCCNGIYYTSQNVCSGHGVCVITSTPSHCSCDTGYINPWCDTEQACGADPEVPYFCSGHGTCAAGECLCKGTDGYAGKACNITFPPVLLPTALEFGLVPVGGTAQAQTLTLKNAFAASVSSIALGGTDAGDFSLGGTCAAGGDLQAQGSCTVTVGFVPTAPGARGATLSVVTSYAATALTAMLSGTGTVGAESVLIDPASSTTLYAGLDGGGVYVSTDGGANWAVAAVQPGNLRVKALAKRSGTPLYAGTRGGGVYKAASGTAFAACVAQPGNPTVLSLALDAAGKLYAGSESGVYVSADGCASWTAISGGLP